VIICLRLVTPGLEGALIEVKPGATPGYLVHDGIQTALVPTGSVENHEGFDAEVWVPENMLVLWELEHTVDS
jgi:hypothetical protein